MKRLFFLLFLPFILLACDRVPANWDFRSFHKPVENPVLKADSTFTFICPVKNPLPNGLYATNAIPNSLHVCKISSSGSLVQREYSVCNALMG